MPLVDSIAEALGDRAPLFAAVGLVLVTYHLASAVGSVVRAIATPVWSARAPFPQPLPPGVASTYFQSKATGLLLKWRVLTPAAPPKGCIFLHHGGSELNDVP